MDFYKLSAQGIKGENVNFDTYRGQALLIVNVASACGFTKQYEGLEDLYRRFHDRGFQVLGFPCNQFGAQEPGSDAEIAQFCERKFSVTFPMFSKVEVNGDSAHPVFQWLKHEAPGLLGSEFIKWNFTKFLVDKTASEVRRYAPTVTPSEIVTDIESFLGTKA